jgi:hypothetical protein
MKKLTYVVLILIMGLMLFSTCKKDDPAPKGKVVFWNDAASGLGNVTVTMGDNTAGIITSDYTGSPDCDAAGCFTYTNNAGVYSYSAQEDGGGKTWHGTVTITENGCLALRLM